MVDLPYSNEILSFWFWVFLLCDYEEQCYYKLICYYKMFTSGSLITLLLTLIYVNYKIIGTLRRFAG